MERLQTEPPVPAVPAPAARDLEQVRLLARLLDDAFPIPGTSYRIGIDPLIGLVPGLGDLLGAFLSGWILLLGARLGAPRPVLARMALNVAVDTLIGIVPGVGDLFDFAWKANRRNVALLEAWQARPAQTRRGSALRLGALAALALAAAAALAWAGWQLVAWAVRAVSGG